MVTIGQSSPQDNLPHKHSRAIIKSMKLTTTNKDVVEEYAYGMYVWQLPDGTVLADDDDNVMNVFCMKGNREKIALLAEAAKYYGFPEGRPLWWPGKRRITDEELEHQRAREAAGLVPDPMDFAAIRDEEKALRNHDKR